MVEIYEGREVELFVYSGENEEERLVEARSFDKIVVSMECGTPWLAMFKGGKLSGMANTLHVSYIKFKKEGG